MLKLVTSGEWAGEAAVGGDHYFLLYINHSVSSANIRGLVLGFVCFYILRPRKGSGEIGVVKRKGLYSSKNVVSIKAFVHLCCCFFLFVCSGYQSFHIYNISYIYIIFHIYNILSQFLIDILIFSILSLDEQTLSF